MKPTAEQLKDPYGLGFFKTRYSYDKETGLLVSRKTGTAASTRNANGYIRINTRLGWKRKEFLAHRVAWLLHYGHWPEGEIDHINGIRDDNRIENLRVVSRTENSRNVRRRVGNTTGVTGVHQRENGKLRASYGSGSSRVTVGHFTSIQDAEIAIRNARLQAGYHQNHGSEPNG